MITKKCPKCNKIFNTYKSIDKKYCSVECSIQYNKTWCVCKICKKRFAGKPCKYRKYCSKRCYGDSRIGAKHSKKTITKMSGKNHPRWKGGKKISRGYIHILKPNHPHCNPDGYIREHRFVMEQHLKRYLTREEVVHHKGTKYPMGSYEDKGDNRIQNLQLFPNDIKHRKFHRELKYRRC